MASWNQRVVFEARKRVGAEPGAAKFKEPRRHPREVAAERSRDDFYQACAGNGPAKLVEEGLARGWARPGSLAPGVGGRSALHWGVLGGKLGMVEKLLAAGADVEARDAERRTPLMLAAAEGFDDIVMGLLAEGAEADARDSNGDTALMCAAMADAAASVEALIHAGADIGAMGACGIKPLGFACQEKSFAAMDALLRAGAHKEDGSLGQVSDRLCDQADKWFLAWEKKNKRRLSR